MSYGLGLFLLLLGGSSVFLGLFGNRYYFKPLGSRQEGPPMPNWLARPLFVTIGGTFLYVAFDLLRAF